MTAFTLLGLLVFWMACFKFGYWMGGELDRMRATYYQLACWYTFAFPYAGVKHG
jgi:hypothetical protein